jgi:hypothetical protein
MIFASTQPGRTAGVFSTVDCGALKKNLNSALVRSGAKVLRLRGTGVPDPGAVPGTGGGTDVGPISTDVVSRVTGHVENRVGDRYAFEFICTPPNTTPDPFRIRLMRSRFKRIDGVQRGGFFYSAPAPWYHGSTRNIASAGYSVRLKMGARNPRAARVELLVDRAVIDIVGNTDAEFRADMSLDEWFARHGSS